MDTGAFVRELLASPPLQRDARLAGVVGTPAARRVAWALHADCAAHWRHSPARVQDAADCLGLLALMHRDAEIAALSDWLDCLCALAQGQTARACRLMKKSGATFALLGDHADTARAMSRLAEGVAQREARRRRTPPD